VAGDPGRPRADAHPPDAAVDHHDTAPDDAADAPHVAAHPTAPPDVVADAAHAAAALHDSAALVTAAGLADGSDAAGAAEAFRLRGVRVVVDPGRLRLLSGRVRPRRISRTGPDSRRWALGVADACKDAPVTRGGLDPPPRTRDGRRGPGWGGPDE
jgi:hypothetical protein